METRVDAAAADGGEELEHRDDETGYAEAADAAVVDFVETAHGDKVFYEQDKDGHGRVGLFPALEGLVGDEAGGVLEGDVDVDAGSAVDELDDGYFGFCDYLEAIVVGGDFGGFEGVGDLAKGFGGVVFGDVDFGEGLGDDDEVDVGGGKVEFCGEGAEDADVSVRPHIGDDAADAVN